MAIAHHWIPQLSTWRELVRLFPKWPSKFVIKSV